MFLIIELGLMAVVLFAVFGLYGKLDDVLKAVHRLEQQNKPPKVDVPEAAAGPETEAVAQLTAAE